MTQKYNLILIGKKNEVAADKATGILAKIFKTSPEKAAALLNKPTIIKKNIEKNTAEHDQKKLDALGLKTVVKAVVKAAAEQTPAPQPESASSGLSLVPEETPPKAPEKAPSPLLEETVQTATASDDTSTMPPDEITNEDEYDEDDETPMEKTTFLQRRLIDDITGLSVIVGVVTAVLGALLWRLIAVSFHMEIAWVAILIGAAIGFAVATSGGYGRSTGILCAVLAVIAILLGKYWAVQGVISNTMDELRVAFQSEFVSMQEKAGRYSSNMSNEEFITLFQSFSADSQFSDLAEVLPALDVYIDELSPEEVSSLRTELEPELNKMTGLSFDEWFENEVLPEIEGMQDAMGLTAAGITKENFDYKDIIFLLVGVFAAFKVGGREDY